MGDLRYVIIFGNRKSVGAEGIVAAVDSAIRWAKQLVFTSIALAALVSADKCRQSVKAGYYFPVVHGILGWLGSYKILNIRCEARQSHRIFPSGGRFTVTCMKSKIGCRAIEDARRVRYHYSAIMTNVGYWRARRCGGKSLARQDQEIDRNQSKDERV